ncbi:hypothetical protein [Streptococcus fryi]
MFAYKSFLADRQRLIFLSIIVIVGFLSFFVIAESDWVLKMNTSSLHYLNEKREQVMKLTALSGGLSTLITLIPGEVGIPIAENIADIADYLLIVYAGIWVQKYIIIVASSFAFKVFIPIACFLSAINLFTQSKTLWFLVKRMMLLSLLLLTIIPASVSLGKSIEDAYQYSIEERMEEIDKLEKEQKKNKGIFDKVTGFFSNPIEKFETASANMIDAAVVLIITSCGIPIMVLFIFIAGIKYLFGREFEVETINPRLFRRMTNHLKEKKSSHAQDF